MRAKNTYHQGAYLHNDTMNHLIHHERYGARAKLPSIHDHDNEVVLRLHYPSFDIDRYIASELRAREWLAFRAGTGESLLLLL